MSRIADGGSNSKINSLMRSIMVKILLSDIRMRMGAKQVTIQCVSQTDMLDEVGKTGCTCIMVIN